MGAPGLPKMGRSFTPAFPRLGRAPPGDCTAADALQGALGVWGQIRLRNPPSGRSGSRPRRVRAWRRARSGLHDLERLAQHALFHVERRVHAHGDLLAVADGIRTVAEHEAPHPARHPMVLAALRVAKGDAHEQAERPRLPHDRILLEALQDGRRDLAEHRGVLHHPIALEDLEGLERRRTAPRSRRKGAPRPGLRVVAEDLVAGGHAGARLDPAREVLSHDQQVRDHVVVLDTPHAAGSSETRQHLVRDHQPVVPVAELPDTAYEIASRDPIAALGEAGLDQDARDALLGRDALGDVVVEVPEAVLGVLLFAHSGRDRLAVRVGRLDDSTGPGLEIDVSAPVVSAHQLSRDRLAVEGRAESDDVAAALVAERDEGRGFGGFGSGDFEAPARQLPARHEIGQLLGQLEAERVLVVEAVAQVRLVHGLDHLGVGVADRVRGPAVLEVDVAVPVEVPDEVSRHPVQKELRGAGVSLAARRLGLLRVGAAAAEVRDPALEDCDRVLAR